MRRIGTLALLCGLLFCATLALTVPGGRQLRASQGSTAAWHSADGDSGGLFASDDDPIAQPATGAPLPRPSLPQIAPLIRAGDSIDLTPPGPVPRGAYFRIMVYPAHHPGPTL